MLLPPSLATAPSYGPAIIISLPTVIIASTNGCSLHCWDDDDYWVPWCHEINGFHADMPLSIIRSLNDNFDMYEIV